MNANPDTPPASRGDTTTAAPSDDSPGPIIAVLVALRKANRLSQQYVADRMGTQQSAVSELERGITEARMSTLIRYARACGADLKVTVQIVADMSALLPEDLP